jgi:UDP-N-acetylglucosamine 2-epimerase
VQERPDIALCYGTRPQVIKTSRLLPALRERWSALAIDTGQHYDYELNALLYQQLGVPPADVVLGVGSLPRLEQVARIAALAGEVLERHRPRVVVTIGDTNSTLGCTLAAARRHIPLVHVEAGLRSGDPLMAEEINRTVADALSAILCAPSVAAMRTLESEGYATAAYLTGDVSRDVLEFATSLTPSDTPIPGWPLAPDAPYVFATMHRAELVDDDALLHDAFRALRALDGDVVCAAHPRTMHRLLARGLSEGGSLHIIPPLGYLDAVHAVRRAALVVTDSGGVQREAYWLGVPCVTLRRETEWTETTACGANTLVAPGSVERLLPGVVAILASRVAPPWPRDAYGTGHTARLVCEAIESSRLLELALRPST